MLKKGIIMSLSPSYAVVLEKGGAFHHIQLKENMTIGQAILFTDEDILSQVPSLVYHLRPLMTLAAALVLFLIPTFYAVQTPYAVISLDINPSVELLLNKQGTVKKAIAKNEDGVTLNLSQLKGHTLEDALHNLSGELTLQDFIGTSPSILVSYADLKTNSLDLAASLHTYMETNFKDSHIVYLPSDKQTYSLSNKAHLSLGRYSASQLLSEQLPEIDFETIDISNLIHYLEADEDLDADDDESNILVEDADDDVNDSNEPDSDDDIKNLDELPLSKPVSSSNTSTQKPNHSNNSSTKPPSNTVEDSNDEPDDDDSHDKDDSDDDDDLDKDNSDDDDDLDKDHSDDDDDLDKDHSDDDNDLDKDHSDDDDDLDKDHSDDDDDLDKDDLDDDDDLDKDDSDDDDDSDD